MKLLIPSAVFVDFAIRNHLPIKPRKEMYHLCTPSDVSHLTICITNIGLWHMFLRLHLFSGPNSHSSICWISQVSQEGQEELLEASMEPSTMAFHCFFVIRVPLFATKNEQKSLM